MAGIYIHIPFCRKKCHYCDFHTSVNLKNKDALVDSIISELDIQKKYLDGEDLNTIYFGGGTPSLLEKNDLERILEKVNENFTVSKNAEITLEANPDDLIKEKILEIKEVGVNRLSIGLQSFDDDKLILMNRRHDSQQAFDSVLLAKELGFDNISIDLIYGLPGLSLQDWKSTVNKALELKVQHISSYHLTYEPKTVFYNHLQKGKIVPLSDESGYDQFLLLKELTSNVGFEHYEISNFALQGYRSKHNGSYWKQEKYLGIGPSAHSFDGNTRQWNVSNNTKYIEAIATGKVFFESEILDLRTKFNEYIMTSLRTMDGVDLNFVEESFGLKYKVYLEENVRELIKRNQAVMAGNFLKLSSEGIFISDRIISDLFIVE